MLYWGTVLTSKNPWKQGTENQTILAFYLGISLVSGLKSSVCPISRNS